jgi:hypothetical protein
MKIALFLFENWYLLVMAAAVIIMTLIVVIDFAKMPRKKQIDKAKEWLLWAVIAAEKELGGGTGALKLRKVYDLFIQRFPMVAVAVSFDTFKQWVDVALAEMQQLIADEKAISDFLEGDK